MSNNTNKKLNAARLNKNDEFYTRLCDIENELIHYRPYFKGKVVYCNCDNPNESNFFKYFVDNFKELYLKKVVATGFNKDGFGYYGEYSGDEVVYKTLDGDGDFRSVECIGFLKEVDVVVTNPPFSLFREYIGQLFEYDKKFLIIGNNNAINYKEVFPCIKNNQLWLGVTNPKEFIEPNNTIKKFGNIWWFTNIQHNKKNPPLKLTKNYYAEVYPKYDNYDAIEVSKVIDIPMDYDGVMGVPITFLDKYCPEQFEIVDALNRYAILDVFGQNQTICEKKSFSTNVNGKPLYKRILIKRKTGVYPKYDNYDAIEVSKVADIPKDYDGVMGVPITFLDKYCPEQFEIVGLCTDKRNDNDCFIKCTPTYLDEKHKNFVGCVVKGKATYARILIKRKK